MQHCSVYYITFVVAILTGQNPAQKAFTFTDDDAVALREQIVLCLTAAIPVDNVVTCGEADAGPAGIVHMGDSGQVMCSAAPPLHKSTRCVGFQQNVPL